MDMSYEFPLWIHNSYYLWNVSQFGTHSVFMAVFIFEHRFFVPIFKECVKMSKQKKPYVKPEIAVIPAGSPKYNEIMTAVKEAGANPPCNPK